MPTRFSFTKTAIDALPLPKDGKRAIYYDTKEACLALRVTARGKRSFYVIKRLQGQSRFIHIGDYPTLPIEAARLKAKEIVIAAALGAPIAKALLRPRHEMTFSQLGEWWLEQVQRRGKKSWELDQWILNGYLATLKNRRLSAIAKGELRELHAKLTASHGPAAANKAMELARAIFNRARRYDVFAGENPALGVELNRVRSRDRRLTAAELPKFFEALEADPSDVFRDYVYMSLFTGARQANVLAMRWDEIDFTGRTWRIPETKNGLPQVIPLGLPELELLHRRRATSPSPWVFPSWSKTGHMTEPKNGWRRLLAASGLRDLRMHDLRRTLGSWMADTGASLHVIGKTLGHQSSAATQIYARLSLDPVRLAKERAVEAILQVRSGEPDANRTIFAYGSEWKPVGSNRLQFVDS